MSSLHKNINPEHVHVPYAFTVDDEEGLALLVPDETDEGKLVLRKDNNDLLIIIGKGPFTYKSVGVTPDGMTQALIDEAKDRALHFGMQGMETINGLEERMQTLEDSTGATTGLGALIKTNNLRDLENVSQAVYNLGLKDAAMMNVGTTANTVAAGDDPRFAAIGSEKGTPVVQVVGDDEGAVMSQKASTDSFVSIDQDQTIEGVKSFTQKVIDIGGLLYGSDSSLLSLTLGSELLQGEITGYENTSAGNRSLASNISGGFCTAFGSQSLEDNTSGSFNTAVGRGSLDSNTSGQFNTAVGQGALASNTTGGFNTAVGAAASVQGEDFSYCTVIGANATLTGTKQNQIGSSGTTTYVHGTIQNRSDARDKADVRNTELGLSFIESLRPVDYKWDMREDYADKAPVPVSAPVSKEGSAEYTKELAAFNKYLEALDNWKPTTDYSKVKNNGTHKRNRYHHGFIAQEVEAVIKDSGVDFGGFQDHKLGGGSDVLSIGYDEFIAPLVRAVQELSAQVKELQKSK